MKINLSRASYTVELALLLPLILGTILALIYLNFHVHNCAALTANACEAAVTGHPDAEFPSYVFLGRLNRSVDDDKASRTVTFSSVTYDADERVFGESVGTGTYKKVYPVSDLRKAKGLRELMDQK